MKRNSGFAQIPLMIGLLLMAIAIPAVTTLVQKSQDTRNYARTINDDCSSDADCGANMRCNKNTGSCVSVVACKPTRTCVASDVCKGKTCNDGCKTVAGTKDCDPAPTKPPVATSTPSCYCSQASKRWEGTCGVTIIGQICSANTTTTPIPTATRVPTVVPTFIIKGSSCEGHVGETRCSNTSQMYCGCAHNSNPPTGCSWFETPNSPACGYSATPTKAGDCGQLNNRNAKCGCSIGWQCASGVCLNYECEPVGSCSQIYNKQNGCNCTSSNECAFGLCNSSGKCSSLPTPTSGMKCCCTFEGGRDVCSWNKSCSLGYSDSDVYYCKNGLNGTNTPTPTRLPTSSVCKKDGQCKEVLDRCCSGATHFVGSLTCASTIQCGAYPTSTPVPTKAPVLICCGPLGGPYNWRLNDCPYGDSPYSSCSGKPTPTSVTPTSTSCQCVNGRLSVGCGTYANQVCTYCSDAMKTNCNNQHLACVPSGNGGSCATPTSTVKPTSTPTTSKPTATPTMSKPTATPTKRSDSCGSGWKCASYAGGTACMNAGGEIDTCINSNGGSGNCCVPATSSPVPTTKPTSGGGVTTYPPQATATQASCSRQGGSCVNNNSCCGTLHCNAAKVCVGTVPTDVPQTPTACKQCPADFKCYKNGNELKWFVTGYAMNGFANVADAECTSANVAKPSFKGKEKGDANCDGSVDVYDYSLWLKEYSDGSQGTVKSSNWNSDFTGINGKCDQLVDVYDFSLWLKYYGELN